MTDSEYLLLRAREASGEVLPVVDALLLKQERAWRERKPNALEQLMAERRRNPLLPATRND